VATTDVKTAFTGVQVAVLVGGFPRKDGMERKELIAKNIPIFVQQARAVARVRAEAALLTAPPRRARRSTSSRTAT
jgi:malate dehydrogenase